jgi:hypothetical protein
LTTVQSADPTVSETRAAAQGDSGVVSQRRGTSLVTERTEDGAAAAPSMHHHRDDPPRREDTSGRAAGGHRGGQSHTSGSATADRNFAPTQERRGSGQKTHPAERRQRHAGVDADTASAVHPSERRRRARMGTTEQPQSGSSPTADTRSRHPQARDRGEQRPPRGQTQSNDGPRQQSSPRRQTGRHPAAGEPGGGVSDLGVEEVLESEAMLDQVVGKLYRELERKIRIERRRRGL